MWLMDSRSRLMQLLLWRGLAVILILMLVGWSYFPTADFVQRQMLASIGVLFVFFAALQMLAIHLRLKTSAQFYFQFTTDIILTVILVLATDGYQSPFILMFGLIIVAAGTQAQVLLVLSIAVTACMGYLVSIYVFAWWQHLALHVDLTLTLLLQTSVLLLVGGIMAVIARRHGNLSYERSKAVREHKHLQALHTRLMESMQEGVLVLDEQLNVRDSNPAVRHIFQIETDATVNIHELWHENHAVLNFLEHAKLEKYRGEWKKNEIEYLVTIGRFPEIHADACWWLTFVDVSELRSLERNFAEHEKLAAMGRMAAMLAHELRNPMQTISQAVELVTRVPASHQQDIQRIVGEETKRLNRLVADMLDYTKPLNPKHEVLNPATFIHASIHQIDAESKYKIGTHIELDEMNVDGDHLRLVLDNLLRNAVLSSPTPASVDISLKKKQAGWILTVSDHGEGISEAVKARMFEPFASYRDGGTGLGLATVWQICKANDWEIGVESSSEATVMSICSSSMES